ncbi:MAG TPA: DUF5684 domain-containing protein [Phycisphaerales bacterium]|nr:DUF5684 domain-containing protein [Phycisphaerales bacterium]
MDMVMLTLAQNSDDFGFIGGLFYLTILALIVASWWIIFQKAGQPGWTAIIPIVNMYFLCKVAGRPGWWVILFFIPIVNIVISAIVSIDVAKSFGKGTGFGIGLWLLGIIFYPVLAFSGAEYQGPAA